MEDCKIEHFDKLFANCKIVWNIENFCFALSPEASYICSPEFKLKAIQVTRWRMIIELKWEEAKDGYVSVSLERLPHPGPDIVWANWEIVAIVGNKQYAPIEHSCYFDQNSKIEVRLQSITNVVASLMPFEPDTFRIECMLIVRKQSGIVKMPKPIHPGIKSLSGDLKKMLKDTKYQDVTVRIDEQYIKAHKAVLSRNKIFRYLIGKAKNDVIELENLDYEAVSKFIAFVYSGNTEFILGSPSVAMFKCVKFFNCDVLMCFFAPEQLHMHTKVEVEEHELHWVINAFSERKDRCISSPFFKGINASTTWQLHFYTDTEDNDGHFSIFAAIVAGTIPKYFSLEFAVENVSGLVSHPNRILRFDGHYDDMGFKEFVRKSFLEKSTIFTDDTLNVVFKARTSEGGLKSSLGSRIMSFITVPRESPYEKVSSGMEDLLNGGTFSDIVLHSERERFKAHKCILSARSPNLFRVLHMSAHTNVFVFSIIESNVLRILLRFLYSGDLKNIESSDLLKLYRVSVSFSISCLTEMCVKILKEKIANDGRATVLDIAKKIDLESLVLDVI